MPAQARSAKRQPIRAMSLLQLTKNHALRPHPSRILNIRRRATTMMRSLRTCQTRIMGLRTRPYLAHNVSCGSLMIRLVWAVRRSRRIRTRALR
ncbi:hypothetical protein AZE42_11398 [Rhizopogon vesiculosus]|uniref:Uncharacterized protein n=1 Tax=Rhizopogon vesiculosus TaxID=180088 RepID=A0A1J8R7G8_9AGAM|nr:hypothetical protein AZE42_11398 [Rhizopogon vesiculosus]